MKFNIYYQNGKDQSQNQKTAKAKAKTPKHQTGKQNSRQEKHTKQQNEKQKTRQRKRQLNIVNRKLTIIWMIRINDRHCIIFINIIISSRNKFDDHGTRRTSQVYLLFIFF